MWLPPSRSLSRRLRLKLPLRLRTLGFSRLSWHMSRCSSRSTMSISRSASSCSRRRSCSSWKRCSWAARSSSSSRLRSSWGADGRLGAGPRGPTYLPAPPPRDGPRGCWVGKGTAQAPLEMGQLTLYQPSVLPGHGVVLAKRKGWLYFFPFDF